jgi:hypothetical protein
MSLLCQVMNLLLGFTSEIHPRFRERTLATQGLYCLRSLCRSSGYLPQSYLIKDELLKEPAEVWHVQGGLSDVYRARYRDTTVCLKCLRIHPDDKESVKKVVQVYICACYGMVDINIVRPTLPR